MHVGTLQESSPACFPITQWLSGGSTAQHKVGLRVRAARSPREQTQALSVLLGSCPPRDSPPSIPPEFTFEGSANGTDKKDFELEVGCLPFDTRLSFRSCFEPAPGRLRAHSVTLQVVSGSETPAGRAPCFLSYTGRGPARSGERDETSC